jgi:p-hydroxybenzoate 3-monooxygenase
MLSHLLHLEGIESVVLETRSRKYIEERVRAGVLEQGTVDLLQETGLGERLGREGLVHHGIELRFAGKAHRIDFQELAGGKAITIYAQHEVIKDLLQARLAAGGHVEFDVANVSIHDFQTNNPTIRYSRETSTSHLQCDFIAGCDGSHGICRSSIPQGFIKNYEREYPFGWLGILAKVAPSASEIVYGYHERGFALLSMRSPEISRLYVQCAPDEDLNTWPDEKIWEELRNRLATSDGWQLAEGPILQKGVTPMRSYVAEPMQCGRLFLAGDSAHIVPPTGAKGMNLAIADVRVLARALREYYKAGREQLLQEYSRICLRRVWKVQRFSWWMTSMLHRFNADTPFDQRRRLAELDYTTSSRAAAQALAENYVGLPMEWGC